jgi:hypothetical protein
MRAEKYAGIQRNHTSFVTNFFYTKFHNETKLSAGSGEEQLPIAGTVGRMRRLLWCGDEEH